MLTNEDGDDCHNYLAIIKQALIKPISTHSSSIS
eukprot:SAG31_NODE_7141_length_1778_cov_21.200119_1_plen_33_part_01